MLLQSDIDKIVACGEDKGWSVDVKADIPAGTAEFEFSQYTTFGQDLNITCYLKDGDPDTLVTDVYDYWEGYDPDYEAYLWIGEDGHGKNGAPYHISDVVADMEAADKMIKELYDALNKIQFDYDNEDI